ncbi:MAG TPA: DNA-processing protein DprA [Aquabacterium sp.]|uniref:DNA-processing protein DprA n=1 Tax=Aquabacterium sp. TaxID=1872578 RepID=UPI002E304AC9|nr:DNA-processing protein DprA [Aquabacterium sp.]HEX5357356.1 DNA-processing protein DprA [Aquabacterium sp.]
MEQEELRAWLRLVLTPRVGPGTARKLLAALGSPHAIFEASGLALSALVSRREATELGREPEGLDQQVQATQAWLADGLPLASGRRSRFVLSLADPAYPRALLEAADPPLLLFAQGQLDLLARPAVAVVGSRHPTPQGQENAYAFARALSEAGVTVVSGLALGVDGAAHAGALDGLRDATSGSTIAVVGTGLDLVYPKAHQALAQRLSTQGLMLSEFALGTPPLSPNFPKRNRIVAALTRGTLVIEAALQSGSLITARLAAEMGREVLAIPGSIHSPQARGCHALIKQGAKLVETAQDVLEELQLGQGGLPVAGNQAGLFASQGDDEAGAAQAEHAAQEADPVLTAMGYDPVSQEALSARTGLGAADLGARLLELELMGQVARLPGALFQRVGAA